jgi:thermitase
VLSTSWGGGPYSATIRSAFQYARTHGRGGKGCVAICASGNSDIRGLIYPAKYPECLACGASNEWDQRKSKTSLDGENWWGSQYGPEQDFLAPGVHIYTTDITGTGGYSSGDYFNRFNGTSSATPNAAGVAALILSVDPNLKQWEVRDILRLAAKDLGPAGWDEQHGWGRIDAHRALQAASRIWYEVRIRLEFLGSGQECYIRFLLFRLYNSGLNRARINGFNIRSYDPTGAEIDRFEYQPNPGGTMLPGLAPGGGSGQDVQVEGVLLKANGTRNKWSYRWSAHWGYTYWRPSHAVTSPAGALDADLAEVEEEVEQEYHIAMEGPSEGELAPQITIEEPIVEALPEEGEPIAIEKEAGPTKITITIA